MPAADANTARALVPLACLVAGLGAVAVAWYVVHHVTPWIERTFGGGRFPPDAETRARALFLSKLQPGQRRSWLVRRRFTTRGASGCRYTIASYDAYNIRTDDAVFCLQVNGHIPVHDKLLSQKLLIECDEELFLALANVRSATKRWHERQLHARRVCAERGRLPSAS